MWTLYLERAMVWASVSTLLFVEHYCWKPKTKVSEKEFLNLVLDACLLFGTYARRLRYRPRNLSNDHLLTLRRYHNFLMMRSATCRLLLQYNDCFRSDVLSLLGEQHRLRLSMHHSGLRLSDHITCKKKRIDSKQSFNEPFSYNHLETDLFVLRIVRSACLGLAEPDLEVLATEAAVPH